MSDREFGGTDDLSLPKATVQKIISEILATPLPPPTPTTTQTQPSQQQTAQQTQAQHPTFARDARDLLIECSIEFITLLSSEANEIMERESKKTISIEHIDKTLRELGFPEYVSAVLGSAGSAKEELKKRERRTGKLEQSGLSNEELMRMQDELFSSAGGAGAAGG